MLHHCCTSRPRSSKLICFVTQAVASSLLSQLLQGPCSLVVCLLSVRTLAKPVLCMQEGAALANAALDYLQQPGAGQARVGFLHTEPPEGPGADGGLQQAWLAALQLGSRRGKITGYLQSLLQAAEQGAMFVSLACGFLHSEPPEGTEAAAALQRARLAALRLGSRRGKVLATCRACSRLLSMVTCAVHEA